MQARADIAGTVQELDDRDNTLKWRFKWSRSHRRSFIPVAARVWNAIVFRITDNAGGAYFPGSVEVYTTQAVQDLVFRFSTFDEAKEQFEYFPSGHIQTLTRRPRRASSVRRIVTRVWRCHQPPKHQASLTPGGLSGRGGERPRPAPGRSSTPGV